ncbi:MAG TPA: hypothetical protein VGG19_11315 [Tepidisphaeraceae bacterium]
MQSAGSSNAAALSAGTTVGPSSTWGTFGNVGGYETNGTDPTFTSVPGGAYVGIESIQNDGEHYGWMLVGYTPSSTPNYGTIEVYGSAIETQPNVAITVGAVPEPGVAACVIGLSALTFRQRRNCFL